MSPPLAVIVAHGSPSDPEPLDNSVRALAERVGAIVKHRRVLGATLAKSGALGAALAEGKDEAVVIYPFFMSNGWFVRTELRRRVEEIAEGPVSYREPFGLDPALPELCVRIATQHLIRQGTSPKEAVLLLAAHGSATNRAPAEAAQLIEVKITEGGIFGDVRLGFVEEEPSITAAASLIGQRPAVCLPLFATTAGHVMSDVPEQLTEAHFKGTVLPPVGEHDETPRMIARSL